LACDIIRTCYLSKGFILHISSLSSFPSFPLIAVASIEVLSLN
jgi:hypothetical protein